MHAYVYDAVRTPRGKGRADGALLEITALALAAQMLEAVRDRNGLDILLGIVSWKAAKHDALLVAALAGGIVLSMTGMFLRWLSYELEKKRS